MSVAFVSEFQYFHNFPIFLFSYIPCLWHMSIPAEGLTSPGRISYLSQTSVYLMFLVFFFLLLIIIIIITIIIKKNTVFECYMILFYSHGI